MPKNVKSKKNESRRNEVTTRDLIFKETGQEYGKVLKLLGNGRLEVECFDGIKRLGHIRGALYNKIWITVGDIVLVGLRDFQSDKCDVIFKYNPDEVRQLKTCGEIEMSTNVTGTLVQINETIKTDEDCGFTFEDIWKK